jgi:hypothetical protein
LPLFFNVASMVGVGVACAVFFFDVVSVVPLIIELQLARTMQKVVSKSKRAIGCC